MFSGVIPFRTYESSMVAHLILKYEANYNSEDPNKICAFAVYIGNPLSSARFKSFLLARTASNFSDFIHM